MCAAPFRPFDCDSDSDTDSEPAVSALRGSNGLLMSFRARPTAESRNLWGAIWVNLGDLWASRFGRAGGSSDRGSLVRPSGYFAFLDALAHPPQRVPSWSMKNPRNPPHQKQWAKAVPGASSSIELFELRKDPLAALDGVTPLVVFFPFHPTPVLVEEVTRR